MKKTIIIGSGLSGLSCAHYLDKKKFDVVLLTANKNYKDLYKQSKLLNVKNLIITDLKGYDFLKKKK